SADQSVVRNRCHRRNSRADTERKSAASIFLRRTAPPPHFLLGSAMIVKIRRRVSGATFIHPMDPTPRTAILTPGFQETKLVRVFRAGWTAEAARFNPASIAGTTEQLRRLTSHGIELTHSVIAFTYDGDSGLSDDDRELFWQAFGVPAFEEHLGARNELLAM